MGRAKLRIEPISNAEARNMTFKRRKKGLEKAASELSTLCGVDVGMIIYDQGSNEPKIWPRNHVVFSRLIDSYKSRSDFDSRYTSYNLSAYYKDRTERIQDEIKKSREARYPKWDDSYNCLSKDELKEFDSLLMAKIDALRERINLMKDSRSVFPESDVFLNSSVQESAILVQDIAQQHQPLTYYNTSKHLMDSSSVQESAIFVQDIVQQQHPLAYYHASDVSMNSSVQESPSFVQDIAQEQQPIAYYAKSDVLMNPSVQESAIFIPNIVQQQHNQDYKGNPEGSRKPYMESQILKNFQENVYFMPDIIQQQHPLAYNDTQDNMGNLMECSRNLYMKTEFSKNSSVQETTVFVPGMIQQQQPMADYDNQENMGNLMEGSRSLYLESMILKNPSVQESKFFMPDVAQRQQPLAYCDAENNVGNWGKTMMMAMNDGASCSHSTCG